MQEELQWERTSLQSPEHVTPIEKTQRKRLNATTVEKNLAKYLEWEPCPGNATQGLTHELCRRIFWIPVEETASTWPDDMLRM